MLYPLQRRLARRLTLLFGHVTKNLGLKENSNFGPVIINNIKTPIFKVIKKYEKHPSILATNKKKAGKKFFFTNLLYHTLKFI